MQKESLAFDVFYVRWACCGGQPARGGFQPQQVWDADPHPKLGAIHSLWTMLIPSLCGLHTRATWKTCLCSNLYISQESVKRNSRKCKTHFNTSYLTPLRNVKKKEFPTCGFQLKRYSSCYFITYSILFLCNLYRFLFAIQTESFIVMCMWRVGQVAIITRISNMSATFSVKRTCLVWKTHGSARSSFCCFCFISFYDNL